VNNLLLPSDLGLILSYKCQSACAHCLYNCGPWWNDWIAPEEIQEALEITRIWGDGYQVHFTGGEPFLNFPLLLRAVNIAVSLNIPCYVETNAGWCVQPGQVIEKFSTLKQAGLTAILISCSPFHAESIPPKRTLLAIGIALDIFKSAGVMVYLPEWIDMITRFGSEQPTPLNHYILSYGQQAAGLMFWEGYGLISGGRSGYKLGYLTEKFSASEFQQDNCRREILFGKHSHFDLYGNYIPSFCGGLSLGNWHKLPQIMDKYHAGSHPPLIKILIEEGPYGLFCLAKADFGYHQRAEGYAGKCHLCVDVRRHLVTFQDFPELKPSGFYYSIYSR
jgi:hypothetical protein